MSSSSKKQTQSGKTDPKETKKVSTGTDKALKYYPAEDEAVARKARKAPRPFQPRASLTPGKVLILLAGRYRGKRVVLLKTLDEGVLLVTGPFKINGVPLRRVNSRYVIATKTSVDLKGIDNGTVDKVADEDYFSRDKKADKKGSEEAFFNQGKAEKKQVASNRAEDQKKVDKALLANIKKEDFLQSYLGSTFSLRSGDRPHNMVF